MSQPSKDRTFLKHSKAKHFQNDVKDNDQRNTQPAGAHSNGCHLVGKLQELPTSTGRAQAVEGGRRRSDVQFLHFRASKNETKTARAFKVHSLLLDGLV